MRSPAKINPVKRHQGISNTAFRNLVSFAFSFLFGGLALGGEFRVTPIRLDFDQTTKSGVITVYNEGEKLQLQMRAFEWTQDSEGKDQYTETRDIIFFPKLMSLKGNEEGVLRAGIKMPPATQEKTYRLFLEEIPEPQKAEGAKIQLAVRFGVPIFVKPTRENVSGEISSLKLAGGKLDLAVRNSGNVHFQIESFDVKGKARDGKEVFSKQISGWYLLSGISRLYTVAISPDDCRRLATIEVQGKTDRLPLSRKLDVDGAICGP